MGTAGVNKPEVNPLVANLRRGRDSIQVVCAMRMVTPRPINGHVARCGTTFGMLTNVLRDSISV
eukprot:1838028-Heterocapsa_arctica.AAC.1